MKIANVKKAAERFVQWMNDFEKSHREQGNYDNPNKALLDFLDADSGVQFIEDYEEFCKLAELVKEQITEYSSKISTPPASMEEFSSTWNEAKQRHDGIDWNAKEVIDQFIRSQNVKIDAAQDSKEKNSIAMATGMIVNEMFRMKKGMAALIGKRDMYLHSQEQKTKTPQQVAEKFIRWMNKFEESHREEGNYDNPNKALLNFLGADRGSDFIKNYHEFCQVAELVKNQETEYSSKISNPPCTKESFDEALQEAVERAQFYRIDSLR